MTKGKVWGSLGALVAAVIGGVVAVEGGYVNDPNDAGGETNHGITAKVARENGYEGPMQSMPKGMAVEIYKLQYIEQPGFDRVLMLSPAVGHKLVDAGVNVGPGRSARWFQQSLNHLSRAGADFPLVTVDGQIGRQSLAAYEALERKRGRVKACELALKLIDVQQGAHYMALNKPMFIVGWAENRLVNVPLARCTETVEASP